MEASLRPRQLVCASMEITHLVEQRLELLLLDRGTLDQPLPDPPASSSSSTQRSSKRPAAWRCACPWHMRRKRLELRADEGTRTLDLLHGKPCRRLRHATTDVYDR
jgi:hypothetical protein